jgi:hypothetical protein
VTDFIEREYKGTFLTQFDANKRWFVVFTFERAYKPYWPPMDAAENLTQMLKRIKADCEAVLSHSHFDRDIHTQILKVLDEPETHAFARFVVERRKSIKPSPNTHVQKAMSVKPPSDKQIWKLKSLGYKGPKPDSVQAASILIDSLMNAKV